MFERLELLIGKEALKLLGKTSVLVIGLGGVGSYTVEMLVRNNIGKIILVDKDTVNITNINRQLLALNSTVGKNKVDVLGDRIKDINPKCEVIKIKEFITKENLELIFKLNPNYIIDACDTIDTKVELIKEAKKRNVKIISSMGMANKLDLSKISIMPLSKTTYDPLAKIMRSKLKGLDVITVCSTEKPIKSKQLGSISTTTSVAGIMCASYVIRSIIGEV